jgi:hypothetical protein
VSEDLKKITAEEYERLCQEVCASFMSSGDKERDEAVLLHSICSRAHAYLDDRNWQSVRIVGGSLKDISEYNLQTFITARQSESFNPLLIAYKHIEDTLEN